jgi:hypothetical protein
MTEYIPLLKSVVDRLKGQCYLSEGEHECKIRAKKQRTDTDKYCFEIGQSHWVKQTPAEDLAS